MLHESLLISKTRPRHPLEEARITSASMKRGVKIRI
jgi:hypothetical protein